MKTFIFTFAFIACLMLARGLPLEEESSDGAPAATMLIEQTSEAAPQPMTTKVNDEATDSVAQATVPVVKAVCKNVGSFCNQSEECCTLRCASYAHRCVT